jgi:hypothetical protein
MLFQYVLSLDIIFDSVSPLVDLSLCKRVGRTLGRDRWARRNTLSIHRAVFRRQRLSGLLSVYMGKSTFETTSIASV